MPIDQADIDARNACLDFHARTVARAQRDAAGEFEPGGRYEYDVDRARSLRSLSSVALAAANSADGRGIPFELKRPDLAAHYRKISDDAAREAFRLDSRPRIAVGPGAYDYRTGGFARL